MKIICVASNTPGRSGFKWAWEESANMNVWGFAPSLEDIKRRAARMFPDVEIKLVLA